MADQNCRGFWTSFNLAQETEPCGVVGPALTVIAGVPDPTYNMQGTSEASVYDEYGGLSPGPTAATLSMPTSGDYYPGAWNSGTSIEAVTAVSVFGYNELTINTIVSDPGATFELLIDASYSVDVTAFPEFRGGGGTIVLSVIEDTILDLATVLDDPAVDGFWVSVQSRRVTIENGPIELVDSVYSTAEFRFLSIRSLTSSPDPTQRVVIGALSETATSCWSQQDNQFNTAIPRLCPGDQVKVTPIGWGAAGSPGSIAYAATGTRVGVTYARGCVNFDAPEIGAYTGGGNPDLFEAYS